MGSESTFTVLCAGGLAVAVGLFAWPSGQSSSRPVTASVRTAPTPEPEPTTAEKMAVIETNQRWPINQSLSGEFQSLLTRLSRQFPETETEIADLTLTARNVLKNGGITEPMLSLMRMAEAVAPQHSTGSYKDAMVQYTAARQMGRTQLQAAKHVAQVLAVHKGLMNEARRSVEAGESTPADYEKFTGKRY